MNEIEERMLRLLTIAKGLMNEHEGNQLLMDIDQILTEKDKKISRLEGKLNEDDGWFDS